MRFPLLALVFLTGAVRAGDPPYLAAARERQRKAKAFEMSLSIKTEWKNVTAIPSGERGDFSATGTVRFAVDGEKFWSMVEVPTLTGTRDGVIRQRAERAHDGRATRMRVESEQVKGERVGQLVPMMQTVSIDTPDKWWHAHRWTEPLSWVFHDFGMELRADGVETVEGGRCDRYVGPPTRYGGTTTVWFDPNAGHLPRRVERSADKFVADVRYRPSRELGWLPSGWTIRSASTFGSGAAGTVATVTLDSFELRNAVPDERFTLAFPVGSRVVRSHPNADHNLVVAEDGSLVSDDSTAAPTPLPFEPPSVGRTLAVVGVTVGLFVGFVVLLRRLARNRTDEASESGKSPHLPT